MPDAHILDKAIKLLDVLYSDLDATNNPPWIDDAVQRIGVIIAMLRDNYDPGDIGHQSYCAAVRHTGTECDCPGYGEYARAVSE